jgi:hypothetical protein
LNQLEFAHNKCLEKKLENFKLGILIPLKARKVADSWLIVETALKRVLLSIHNQTSNSFASVVVGHDKPSAYNIEDICKNTTFLGFDEFEPPDKSVYSGMDLQLKYEFDRCSKITKGMMHLQSQGVTHWFALDADDLLHSNFVVTINDFAREEAIVIDRGYFYFESRKIINKTNEFSASCGSSCIISTKLTKVPDILDETAYRKTFFGLVSHVHVKDYFASRQINFVVPEKRLVMYVRDHGENISNYYFTNWLPKIKTWLKMHIKACNFTKEEYRFFGFNEEKIK